MDLEIKKEIDKLRQEIDNLERKFLFTGNYKMIAALLDILNVDNIIIPYSELEAHKDSMYVANFDDESKHVTIKKYKGPEYEEK